MRLLAITPPTAIAEHIDPTIVDAWLDAGAREHSLAVLLREPGVDAAAILQQHRLQPLRERLAAHEIPSLLSLDPRTCDAEATRQLLARSPGPPIAGIQLRGDPGAELVDRYRTVLGERVRIGCSVHGADPRSIPADYLCLASIFAPQTVLPGDAKQAIGLGAVTAWARTSSRVIALGGITPDNAAACLRAGAHGVAGIRLFFGPVEEARQDVAALIGAIARATDEHVQA